jgi:hypothetical protein
MAQDLGLRDVRRPRQQLLDGRIVHCAPGANRMGCIRQTQ